MSIRTYAGYPWPYQSNLISMGTIRTEFGGSSPMPISNYYRGGPYIGNSGGWAAMSDTRINGKITTVPRTQTKFSDFVGSLRYSKQTLTYEGSVMQYFGSSGAIANQFAPITIQGAPEMPTQHCGSFRAYSAFHPTFPYAGRIYIYELARALGWARYVRVGLDNSVYVRTRGDEQERKGSNRYTHVRNGGIEVWFAQTYRRFWQLYGDYRRKIAQRSDHQAGRWVSAFKLTAYAASVNDDSWGSGTLTNGSGSGGTFGGGGGGGGLYGGGGSGFTSGSGTRVPANPDTYYDLKSLWDQGCRWVYLMHTMEVNLASCNTNPAHNYLFVDPARIKFET